MQHPHPWLARSAKACIAVSVLYLVLTVGDILLLKHLLNTTGGGWVGWFEWELLATAPTTGVQARIVRERTAARLTHLMLPAAGVFVAVCLRRAATGRLRLTAIAPVGRLWSLAGLWTAVACGGLELANWVYLDYPTASNANDYPGGWVTARVARELRPSSQPATHVGTLNGSTMYSGAEVWIPQDRYPTRRLVAVAHSEMCLLLSGLLPPCLLFCACGVTLCTKQDSES